MGVYVLFGKKAAMNTKSLLPIFDVKCVYLQNFGLLNTNTLGTHLQHLFVCNNIYTYIYLSTSVMFSMLKIAGKSWSDYIPESAILYANEVITPNGTFLLCPGTATSVLPDRGRSST